MKKNILELEKIKQLKVSGRRCRHDGGYLTEIVETDDKSVEIK